MAEIISLYYKHGEVMLLSRKTSYIKRKRVPREILLQKEDVEVQRIVYDLLHKLGIAYKKTFPAEGFAWDGKKLAIRNTVSNIFHDIAHWLVATPERRNATDFGLGSGPDSGKVSGWLIPFSEVDEEELCASVLGICMEHTLLAETKHVNLWRNTAINHCWLDWGETSADWDYFKKLVRRQSEYLIENKFIDSNLSYLDR